MPAPFWPLPASCARCVHRPQTELPPFHREVCAPSRPGRVVWRDPEPTNYSPRTERCRTATCVREDSSCLDNSITSFARCCFNYALDTKQNLWLGGKDTISKIYDGRFKEIFATIYENEFKDNYKGANKVPLKAKYIASHSGRIYVSGADKDNDNVYISDIKSPFYFPVSLPMQLPPNSDKITGIKVDEEVIEMTVSDVCKALGKNIKIVK